jgi:hypothetical protein
MHHTTCTYLPHSHTQCLHDTAAPARVTLLCPTAACLAPWAPWPVAELCGVQAVLLLHAGPPAIRVVSAAAGSSCWCGGTHGTLPACHQQTAQRVLHVMQRECDACREQCTGCSRRSHTRHRGVLSVSCIKTHHACKVAEELCTLSLQQSRPITHSLTSSPCFVLRLLRCID